MKIILYTMVECATNFRKIWLCHKALNDLVNIGFGRWIFEVIQMISITSKSGRVYVFWHKFNNILFKTSGLCMCKLFLSLCVCVLLLQQNDKWNVPRHTKPFKSLQQATVHGILFSCYVLGKFSFNFIIFVVLKWTVVYWVLRISNITMWLTMKYMGYFLW